MQYKSSIADLQKLSPRKFVEAIGVMVYMIMQHIVVDAEQEHGKGLTADFCIANCLQVGDMRYWIKVVSTYLDGWEESQEKI